MPTPGLAAAVMSGASGRVSLWVVVLLVASAGSAVAQQERLPNSLWGVRGEVGLGFVEQFVTNYGDRSFYEDRPSGEGVRVAVIDTGLASEHPDLDGKIACEDCWKGSFDCRGQQARSAPDPVDDNGHGTHVAGIIAGNGHTQLNPTHSYFPTGAWGLAPDADLVVAKAMNATGGGSDKCVADAIRWSLDPDGVEDSGDEPHIVHLSLGVQSGDGSIPTGSQTEDAVREAIDQGIFVVMSAGNQGQQGPAVPGNVDGVVAVGALDSNGEPLEMSNRGDGVDVFAPGVIMSTWPSNLDQDGIDDGYTGLAGTSQAAPVVTGGLALTLEANPSLKDGGQATKVQHIETMIQRTGNPVNVRGDAFTTFDGNELLASQDKGTDELAWGVVTTVSITLLIVLAVLGRAGFSLLASYAEDDGPVHEPGPSTSAEAEPDEASSTLTPSGTEAPGDQ
jgi:subtilisin family serine protease